MSRTKKPEIKRDLLTGSLHTLLQEPVMGQAKAKNWTFNARFLQR